MREAMPVSDPASEPDGSVSADEPHGREVLHLSPQASGGFASLFGGHLWFALTSSTLYALLYAVALLLETAYQFDRYGAMAVRLVPAVFGWIFLTSLAGLAVDARRTLGGRGKGAAAALICLVGSALLLYGALCSFLPGSAVTESSRQTQTAQGAYLKNVLLYFLPVVVVVFVLVPFHFVVSLQRDMHAGGRRRVHDLLLGRRRSVAPENAIYLRVTWLAVILSGAAVTSMLLTFHLLENIKPHPYMNMFTQLVVWRVLLYFALGLGCLIWYAQSLNAMKRECLFSSGSAATC